MPHGHARGGRRTPLYHGWVNLRQRCTNPNHPAWPRYGGRGITYDARWDDFRVFAEEMGPTWFKGAHLHLKNVDGNYEPGNVEWLSKFDDLRLYGKLGADVRWNRDRRSKLSAPDPARPRIGTKRPRGR